MNTKKGFIYSHCTLLRPLVEDDLPLLMEWVVDPEVRQYVLFAYPMMLQAEKKWLDDLAKQHLEGSNITMMVETLEGVPIGTMGLHRINYIHRTATTGAMFGNKKYWGRGYGVATKMHMLKYAFEELNLNRINSSVFAFNERSIRYSQRCGYQIEGRRRQACYKNGRYWDVIEMGVLREEWEEAFKKYQETLATE